MLGCSDAYALAGVLILVRERRIRRRPLVEPRAARLEVIIATAIPSSKPSP